MEDQYELVRSLVGEVTVAVTPTRVYLLWLNDAVLGVFYNEAAARVEATDLMRHYHGQWAQHSPCEWSTDLHVRVLIEARQVH